MKYLTIFLITFLYACAGTKENSEDYSDIYMYDDFYKSNNNQPYRKKSSNGKYILGSYYGDVRTDRDKGFTQVHDAQTQQKMYEIPTFSPANYTFISNDGQKVVCINPNVENDNLIKFYKQGKVFKIYNFKTLLGRENTKNDVLWLYDGPDDYKKNNNAYLMGDTLYVLTKKEHLILFNINSGEIIKGVYFPNCIDKIKYRPYKAQDTAFIHHLACEGINCKDIPQHVLAPRLVSGDPYWHALTQKTNIRIYRRDDYRDTPIFTEASYTEFEANYTHLNLIMTINKHGICENVVIASHADSTKISKIETFLKQCKFEPNRIPYGLDDWMFLDEFYIKI